MSNIILQHFYKEYRIGKKLGEGSYGTVYQVTHITSNQTYALKIMHITNKRELKDAVQEILAMIRFRHPLVIQIHKFYHGMRTFPSNLKIQVPEVGIIMQLGQCSLQDLITRTAKKGKFVPLSSIVRFATKFIHFFAELERLQIYYRDIKPANFIVVNEEEFECKLTDFGLCKEQKIKHLGQRGQHQTEGYAGSFYYSSPQQRQRFFHPQAYKNVPNNHAKNDVYSLGVTLYQLATNQLPESEKYISFKRVMNIHNIESSGFEGELFIELLRTMLEEKEESRPTFVDLSLKIDEALRNNQEQGFQNKDNSNFSPHLQSPEDKALCLAASEPVVLGELQLQRADSVASNSTSTSKIARKLRINTVVKLSTGLPIQSLCVCDKIIFLGTSTGEMRIIYKKKVYQVKCTHSTAITTIEKISESEVWSGDCQGKLLVWDLELIRKIIPDVKSKTIKKKNILFQTTKSEVKYELSHENLFKEKTDIPSIRYGISWVSRHHNHKVIGYHSGDLHIIPDDGEAVSIRPHTASVCTSALYSVGDSSKYLITAGFDGIIRKINLQTNKLENQFLSLDSPILALTVLSDKQTISVLTVSGKVVATDIDLNINYCGYIEAETLLGGYFYHHLEAGSGLLTLSEAGELIQDQNQVVQLLDSKGVHLVQGDDDTKIVLAGFDGSVYLIKRVLEPAC